MKKNLYLAFVARRSNPFKDFLYGVMRSFCSIPRLLLEVFTRTHFGERYFSFSSAVFLAFILAMFPIVLSSIVASISYEGFSTLDFSIHYLTWYGFIFMFMRECALRRKEIKRSPSAFDFGSYSLSTGRLHKWLLDYKYNGKGFDIRTIETIIEPGLFVIIGLALMVTMQWIGIVIFLSGICYSISYFDAYKRGDDFILDIIDERIANEETTNVFVYGLDPSLTKGFSMYGGKPDDLDLRQAVADDIVQNQEAPNYVI